MRSYISSKKIKQFYFIYGINDEQIHNQMFGGQIKRHKAFVKAVIPHEETTQERTARIEPLRSVHSPTANK